MWRKKPIRFFDAALAQLLAERDQMIIVDPDEVVGLDQRRDRLGEALVDPLVAAPKLRSYSARSMR